MSNLPSKGVALITSASRASAPSILIISQSMATTYSGGSQRGGTRLPRASSVARVLGSKSFEPIRRRNRTSLALVARQISAQEESR